MGEKWRVAYEDIQKVKVVSTGNNELVTVFNYSEKLNCIGMGTDAAVFRHEAEPSYAFKVYADDKLQKLEMEKQVYEKLGTSIYFASFFGRGPNFIVLSYEQGNTLYDCLLKGTHIPKKIIEDVENARRYIVTKGLYPRDIHLKNIIMHEGRAKIIDVSEYQNPGNDFRWEYLKRGYEDYYRLIDGRAIPLWLMEVVRKTYNARSGGNFDYESLISRILKFVRTDFL